MDTMEVGGLVLERDPGNPDRWTHTGAGGQEFWLTMTGEEQGLAGTRGPAGIPFREVCFSGRYWKEAAAGLFAAYADLW